VTQPLQRRVLLRDEIETPLGRLVVLAEETGALRLVGWLDDHDRAHRDLAGYATDTRFELRSAPNPGGASVALLAYFDGVLDAIDRLQVADFGTPFQQRVWRELRTIRNGETQSYAALAQRIGAPNAMRAVGLANGKNPINLVVPCHRVIGANGNLTGYGGGLTRKRWLLTHERALPAIELPFAELPRS
jgi:methylated-DNA-[protein]-cysteine S-methyltransferase